MKIATVHPASIGMPLLKRLGEPAFVPDPGLQSLLRWVYHQVGKAAMEEAYADSDHGAMGT